MCLDVHKTLKKKKQETSETFLSERGMGFRHTSPLPSPSMQRSASSTASTGCMARIAENICTGSFYLRSLFSLFNYRHTSLTSEFLYSLIFYFVIGDCSVTFCVNGRRNVFTRWLTRFAVQVRWMGMLIVIKLKTSNIVKIDKLKGAK